MLVLVGCNDPWGSDTGDSGGQPNQGNGQEGSKAEVTLYFPTKDNSRVVSEKRTITADDDEIVKRCIEALMEGPKSEELRKPFPNGTTFLGVNTVGDVAVINFSKEFENVKGQDGLLLRVSLVNTLTELEGIKKVRIMVVGQELTDENGQPYGDIERIPLDSEGKPEMDNETTVVVYYIDADSEKVVAEERTVEIAQGAGIEEIIFEELKKGPEKDGLEPVIPDGTRLLSVNTKDGICTLNLSKEFIDNHIGGSIAETLTLNAIVASYTELPGIDSVQFLIEGEIREVFIHSALDRPIEGMRESLKSKRIKLVFVPAFLLRGFNVCPTLRG